MFLTNLSPLYPFNPNLLQRQIASKTRMESVIFISSEDRLDTFLTTIRSNGAIADSVRSLHIIFHRSPRSVSKLRECLKRLRFIEDLELMLQCISIAQWVRLLRGIRARHLELLYTNAPHHILADFIQFHPTIVYLKIDRCQPGFPSCPLEAGAFPALSDVAAPASCVSSIVQGNPVERVLATQPTDRDVRLPCINLLASLATTSIAINVLQIDFDPTNFDILDRIAKATPYITALNLNEKCQQLNRISRRRAWKDARNWAKSLKKLTYLDTLSLQTTIPLMATPGDEAQEAVVVMRWAGVVFTNNQQAPPSNHHPNLRRIKLQYLANDLNYESQWGRDSIAQWSRTTALVFGEGDEL
ncbi:hypothetical protein BJ138DRAFT_1120190 [Hygrophoropsis aurantiaca]|uniref:Uncharacterized protein n=1 Tax=Hygrophoropsis aurantiaca TaxID=72124 RepID=A0ACB7ZS49_9AGAM|nr:hypothetical protein BJ138DRAFT_1120190 [Hygrophoropsis aurantiaca]